VNLIKKVNKPSRFKELPPNEDIRKFTFGIYDINEDGKISAGELFLFHKFACFF
jgi:Ca2+-binding EF-hand superfamily protein